MGTRAAWVRAVLLTWVLFSEGMVMKGPRKCCPTLFRLEWAALSRSPNLLPLSTPLKAGLNRGGDGVGVGAVCSLSAQLPLPYGLVSVPSSHNRRDAVGPLTPTPPRPSLPPHPRHHVEHSVCGLGLGWNLHVALAKIDSNLQAPGHQVGWPGRYHPGGMKTWPLPQDGLRGAQPALRRPLCSA